jgi:phytanoyl-CoA hydroxylase
MTDIAELWVDDSAGGVTPDQLYRPIAEARGLERLDEFGAPHLDAFREQGFLVFNAAFSAAETQAALDGLLDVVTGKYPEFRTFQYEKAARALLPTLTPDQRQDAVRKVDKLARYEARVRAIVEHPQLLAVLEQLLGGRPVLLNDQALLKPPRIGREKPWHQDLSAFNYPTDSPVVGCWVALDCVSHENGCMHVIPGSHQQGPVTHFVRRDVQICDTAVATDRIVAVPLDPGGLLVFHGLLHHGTPPNDSPRRRRALQFWYARDGLQKHSHEEHQAIWGSTGKDEVCL